VCLRQKEEKFIAEQMRKEYVNPVKLSRPKLINLPESPDLAYANKVTPIQFEYLVAELLKPVVIIT
jgi:hypothetical protein